MGPANCRQFTRKQSASRQRNTLASPVAAARQTAPGQPCGINVLAATRRQHRSQLARQPAFNRLSTPKDPAFNRSRIAEDRLIEQATGRKIDTLPTA